MVPKDHGGSLQPAKATGSISATMSNRHAVWHASTRGTRVSGAQEAVDLLTSYRIVFGVADKIPSAHIRALLRRLGFRPRVLA